LPPENVQASGTTKPGSTPGYQQQIYSCMCRPGRAIIRVRTSDVLSNILEIMPMGENLLGTINAYFAS